MQLESSAPSRGDRTHAMSVRECHRLHFRLCQVGGFTWLLRYLLRARLFPPCDKAGHEGTFSGRSRLARASPGALAVSALKGQSGGSRGLTVRQPSPSFSLCLFVKTRRDWRGTSDTFCFWTVTVSVMGLGSEEYSSG